MDPKNPDVKALAAAVDAAVDKLGPLGTAKALNDQLDRVRLMQRGNEFPVAVYNAKTGESRTVDSKSEEAELGKGWSRTPGDDHRNAVASSGAVAATQEGLNAELAVRRARAAENPADSSVASRPVASDTIITSDATIERPPVGDVTNRPPVAAEPAPASKGDAK